MTRARESKKNTAYIQLRLDTIITFTEKFCKKHLNEEYAQLARKACITLYNIQPSILTKGHVNTLACGIVHALGSINFLFDKNKKPYIKANDLCNAFNIHRVTVDRKSIEVLSILNIKPPDANWCLPSLIADNSIAWMIRVNGKIVDARKVRRKIQEIAYKRRWIPFMPDDKK